VTTIWHIFANRGYFSSPHCGVMVLEEKLKAKGNERDVHRVPSEMFDTDYSCAKQIIFVSFTVKPVKP